MVAVSFVAIVAGLLFVEPVDLEPEDGGAVTPHIVWYETACRSWRDHLLSRIEGMRMGTEIDAPDAALFRAAVARTEGACVDQRWQGLRLFASLDRALGEWRDRRDQLEEVPEAER